MNLFLWVNVIRTISFTEGKKICFCLKLTTQFIYSSDIPIAHVCVDASSIKRTGVRG